MSEKKLEQVNVRLRLVDGNGLYSDEQIKTPEDAVRVMAEAMAELDREELCVVNMDSNGHPINFNVVSIGDLNTSMVSAQNVFKSAILPMLEVSLCYIIIHQDMPMLVRMIRR